jgi:FkbM family methyltransferase
MAGPNILEMIRAARTRGALKSLLRYYGVPGRIGLLARFYSQFIQPGDLCFDLGAHLGDRIKAWSKLGARVVALEPHPQLAVLLRKWYEDRGAATVLEKAIGRSPGREPLYISQGNPTLNTLSSAWMETITQARQFSGVEWKAKAMVEVTTLDALIEEFGTPTFCKLDVEGFELAALEGLSCALPALSFEYVPPAPQLAFDCIARLGVLGEYKYNWTTRELPRWRSPDWLSPQAMRAALEVLSTEARAGDVYARLLA